MAFSLSDCKAITEKIREYFLIDEANSIDKSKQIEDDRFGYSSTHLIVSLRDDRRNLFEYRDIVGLVAEVQVRTVLQHAWAVLDWKIRYKSEIEVPRELRRKLYRISASLEDADEKFSELVDGIAQVRAGYESQLSKGDLDIGLNRESLQIFIEQSDVVHAVLQRTYNAGVMEAEIDSSLEGPWFYLLSSLKACGIETLDDFRKALLKVSQQSIDLIAKIQRHPLLYRLGTISILRDLIVLNIPREDRQAVVDIQPAKSEFDIYHRKEILEF